VYVIGVPAHTEALGVAVILTEVAVVGLTVIVIALLVTVEEVTQISEVVIEHVTTSPFTSVVEL
jgi:hypothetical protein